MQRRGVANPLQQPTLTGKEPRRNGEGKAERSEPLCLALSMRLGYATRKEGCQKVDERSESPQICVSLNGGDTHLPDQTVGNCSWSNFEAAICGYFCLTQPEKTKEIFDKFCLRARSNLFYDLLEEAKEGPYGLNLELAVKAADLIGPSARSALYQFYQEGRISPLRYFTAIATTGSFRQLFVSS